MSTRPRLLLIATTTLGLVVGLALGAGAVLAQGPAASPTPSAPIATPPIAEPATGGAPTNDTSAVTSGGSATAVAGSAIAYPIYAGTPGVAPDHTIVVTGVGQANMKSDGSNHAAAQKTALQAALADAKAQAQTVASATGLKITGVLSVSTSISPYGIVGPMAADSGATSGAPAPDKVVASPEVLAVSVTVAYQVG